MRVYQLCMRPEDSDGEGEDHSEWFSTLSAAKARREALLQERADKSFDRDLEIRRYIVAKLPKKELVLSLLNRSRCFEPGSMTVVVPPYIPDARRKARALACVLVEDFYAD